VVIVSSHPLPELAIPFRLTALGTYFPWLRTISSWFTLMRVNC